MATTKSRKKRRPSKKVVPEQEIPLTPEEERLIKSAKARRAASIRWAKVPEEARSKIMTEVAAERWSHASDQMLDRHMRMMRRAKKRRQKA